MCDAADWQNGDSDLIEESGEPRAANLSTSSSSGAAPALEYNSSTVPLHEVAARISVAYRKFHIGFDTEFECSAQSGSSHLLLLRIFAAASHFSFAPIPG